MSRPYDSMEPKVMDDDMLKAAVGEQGPQEEAGQLAKQEGILFKDVSSSQSDFQNILRIDNLWQFENSKKSQSNNNIIERIEGSTNLIHLVWSDLSFNNIEAIEGSDTSVNSEDSSLSNNRISKVDSLDASVKSQVSSSGNNQISNMMNIIYSRRFPCSRTLSLAGNPVSEAEEYKMFIYAYLSDLVYLDFRRVDEQMREMAKMKHQYSIDESKHREAQSQMKSEEEQAKQEKSEEHKMAFVEHSNGPFSFDSMYSEDVEGNKSSYSPGVRELLEAYKDKFVIICSNIFEYGSNQQEKRKVELDTFNECIQEAISENQDQGKLKVAKFEEKHLSNLNAIREETDSSNIEKKSTECTESIGESFNTLMISEMQSVEQSEETINIFERNITDLVGLFIENVQSLYPFCDNPYLTPWEGTIGS